MNRTPNQNEEALLRLLGCDKSEVRRHSPTVYEWREVYFEVLTKEQKERGKVPASWYTPLEQGFYIRELGKQAAIVKKIKQRRMYG